VKRLLYLSGISLLVLIALVSAEAAGAQSPGGNDRVRVFIELPDRSRGEDDAVLSSLGGEKRHEFLDSRTISAELPAAAVNFLQRVSSRFLSVRPVPQAMSFEDATDWGVRRVDAPNVWGGSNAALSVNGGNAGAGVRVAVIDTGIESSIDHSDLNLAGRVQCVTPTSLNGGCSTSGVLIDEQGHGTHVAGTIAARDNDTGLIGVAPQVSLYSLKVFGPSGGAYYDDIAAALNWASGCDTSPCGARRADIVNMSLGGSADDPILRNAADAAYNAGVLLVAAAGNSGSGTNTVGYPARYDSVIAVAATCGPSNTWLNSTYCSADGTRASFSSTGPAVELAAPGAFITSTYYVMTAPYNGYGIMSGTSMASPHVAGVAALLMSCDSSLTNAQVRGILQSTATDLGTAGRDNLYGYGLVQSDAAIAAASCGGGTSEPPSGPPPAVPAGYLTCAANAPVTSSSGDNNGYQTNPANAFNDNSVFAVDTNSGSNNNTSCTNNGKDKHHFSAFNFNLPPTAVIQGIQVRLDARADATSGSPRICVQISWNGGTSWTTAKQTSTLTTSEATYTLGGTADTWGRAWTVGNFSNANFRIRVIDVASNTSRDFSLDYVAVNVTYQP
jgi:subtilisin family serine protease